MKEVNELNNKTSKTNLQRTSKMYSKERGITLIALVITIIILIILAIVTITLVFGEGGLIQRAQEGKILTDQAQKDEQDELKGSEEYINGILVGITNPPEEKSEVEEARDSGTPFEDTTIITDDLDNPVTVPGGFNIAEDSGTKVEEGIVIEDSNNNQFVWIPVGEYNVTTEIEQITEPDAQDGKLTNELTRRTFTSTGSTLVNGDDAISVYYCGEGDNRSVAYGEIDAFLENAKPVSESGYGGFYIGRYEAGTETERTAKTNPLTMPLVQANKYPYGCVTRDQAKQQAEAMYNGNEFVTSQLISSYAWDTALNFICQTNEEGYLLSITRNDSYGNINTGASGKTQTGGYPADCYSNIYDFLGNCSEWTTEYYSALSGSEPCVYRGGDYFFKDYYAASRQNLNTSTYRCHECLPSPALYKS